MARFKKGDRVEYLGRHLAIAPKIGSVVEIFFDAAVYRARISLYRVDWDDGGRQGVTDLQIKEARH